MPDPAEPPPDVPPTPDSRAADNQSAWIAFVTEPSERTFARFYEGTSKLAYRICNEDAGPGMADDCLQETYAHLHSLSKQAERALAVADITDLVATTARRICNTSRRRDTRRGSRYTDWGDDEVGAVAHPGELPDRSVARTRRSETVERSLGDLPDDISATLRMFYYEDLTFDELAERLGVSRSKAVRTVDDGKKRLASLLRQRGVTESALAAIFAALAAGRADAAGIPAVAGSVVAGAAPCPAPAPAGGGALAPVVTATATALAARGVQSAGAAAGRPSARTRWLALAAALAASAVAAVSLSGFAPARRPAPPAAQARAEVLAKSAPGGAATLSVSDNPRDDPPTPRRAGPAMASGRVVLMPGSLPLASAEVSVARPGGPAASAVTDAEGRFAVPVPGGAGAGELRVDVRPPAPLPARWTTAKLADTPGIDLGDMEVRAPGRISGRVAKRSVETSEPLSGVRVELLGGIDEYADAKRPRTTTTATDGTFAFDGLVGRRYGMWSPDMALRTMTTIMLPDEPTTHGMREGFAEIEVGVHSLSGKVESGGIGVAGAFLRAERYDAGPCRTLTTFGASTTTSGVFQFYNMPEGNWRLRAARKTEHFGRDSTTILPSAEVRIEARITSAPSVSPTLVMPIGVIEGIVLDSIGRGPSKAGECVSVVSCDADHADNTFSGDDERLPRISLSISTAVEGRFRVEGLPPGRYRVVATSNNMDGGSESAVGETTVSRSGASSPLILRRSPASGTLVTVVLAEESGRPVPAGWCHLFPDNDGPLVRLHWPENRPGDGSRVMKGIPPGRYLLETGAYGRGTRRSHITIQPDSPTRLKVTLPLAGSLRLVLRDKRGRPCDSATCLLEPVMSPPDTLSTDRAQMGHTDSEGVWMARGVVPGRYRLTAQSGGMAIDQMHFINASNTTFCDAVLDSELSGIVQPQ